MSACDPFHMYFWNAYTEHKWKKIFSIKNTDKKLGWTQMVEILTYILCERNGKYKNWGVPIVNELYY